MPILSLSSIQNHILMILLDAITSDPSQYLRSKDILITKEVLKDYIMRNIVTSIQVKTDLVKNLEKEISTMASKKIFELVGSDIIMTKQSICTYIKPLVRSRTVNSSELLIIESFFRAFNCPVTEEVIIDIL